jgi:hypothetical protein
MKSNKQVFNWGCIQKGVKGYRKALRQCKKNKKRFGVGFDNTETWSLDWTFLIYLYNTRWIREHDEFLKAYMFQKEDEYICDKYNIPEYEYQNIFEIEYKLISDIFTRINQLDDEKKKQLCDFLIPRLIVFKENLHGYPGDMYPEEWDKYIDDTIEELKQLKFDKFEARLGCFWD